MNPPDPDALRDRRVLVTGGGGFLGGRLVSRLLAVGAVVHVVSRTGQPWPGCEMWNLDLVDAAAVDRLLGTAQPDVVFHLAGRVSGARQVDEVLPMVRCNLESTVNLLVAATRHGDPRVVLAGSMEERCAADGPRGPSSPYAAAKGAATEYARLFAGLWALPVTVLRIAMAYGPGQADRSKLVPHVVTELLAGRRPRVTSGTRLVDWVYVDDVVDAFVSAACAGRAPTGAVVDVGTGLATSIHDTVQRLIAIVGTPVGADFGSVMDRPLDGARIANPGPAAELFGWRPRTPLDDGLRRTVAWYQRPAMTRTEEKGCRTW